MTKEEYLALAAELMEVHTARILMLPPDLRPDDDEDVSIWQRASKAIRALVEGSERTERVVVAGEMLIADVKSRYPGEDLRCPYMIELDASIEAYRN